MEREHGFLQKISRKIDLPSEILSSDPTVELKGRSEAIVIQHKGILEYTPQRIQIASRAGCICICGQNLDISLMNRERVAVFGQIESVQYRKEPCL